MKGFKLKTFFALLVALAVLCLTSAHTIHESVDNRGKLCTFIKGGVRAAKYASKDIWTFSREIVRGARQTFPSSKNILHFSKGKEKTHLFS
jgi:hypothetical protein